MNNLVSIIQAYGRIAMVAGGFLVLVSLMFAYKGETR